MILGIIIIILCIVLFGLKYWLIGTLLGVAFVVGIFIKYSNDLKKNKLESEISHQQAMREHNITQEDVDAYKGMSGAEYANYLINQHTNNNSSSVE